MYLFFSRCFILSISFSKFYQASNYTMLHDQISGVYQTRARQPCFNTSVTRRKLSTDCKVNFSDYPFLTLKVPCNWTMHQQQKVIEVNANHISTVLLQKQRKKRGKRVWI
jgi:hypothetical protein